ncbi:MAG TPA: hypothetical protein VMU19_11215 [Bryobacteraceae bacterium]|nr:hypothetical protein [Bryobacteraceae bacterium]
MTLTSAAVVPLLAAAAAFGQPYTIDSVAGGALSAPMAIRGPQALALDAAGNLYFATQNHLVFRRDAASGAISVVAGTSSPGFSGDNGPAVKAQLRNPSGLAVDASGDLYIADSGNARVRKVAKGIITTVAGGGSVLGDGGPATKAELQNPAGLAIGPSGDLYICDSQDNRVRRVSTRGVITTIAGTGSPTPVYHGDTSPAATAELNSPNGIALSAAGDFYIAELGGDRIRKVSGETISTFAGNGQEGFAGDDGPAIKAPLCNPYGIAVDSAGAVYVADFCNTRIRKIVNGVIATIAGSGTGGFSGDKGPATAAQLTIPEAVAVDSKGRVYVADTGNDRVRVLIPAAP